MKSTLLISLFILTAALTFCQSLPIDPATGRITYTDVVKVDGATKAQLYKAFKYWVINTYNTNNNLAQLTVDEDATIILKPVMTTYFEDDGSISGFIHYTVALECKDGKYRYTFLDFSHEKPSDSPVKCDGGNLENEKYKCPSSTINKIDFWAGVKKQTNKEVLALIADMQQFIIRNVQSKQSDW